MSFINAAVYYGRARRHVISEPELAASYGTLIKGYLAWTNIPWVVMGLVVLSGGADNVFDFLSPRERGAGVMIWYVSAGMVWLAMACWILFFDGDVALSKHKAFFGAYFPRSPYMIRLYAIFMILVGVIVFALTWSGYVSFNINGLRK